MCKSNGSIVTNLLGINPTNEHNGLKITVPMDSSQLKTAVNCLYTLCFFPNIYIDVEEIQSVYEIMDYNTRSRFWNINKVDIKRFKYFSICKQLYQDSSRDRVPRVLLGNVLYPLDLNQLNIKDKDCFKNTCACLNVPIGSVTVTPNREAILYSEETKKYLEDCYNNAIKEILEMSDKLNSKDYTDVKEYNGTLYDETYYHPMDNTITSGYASKYGGFKIESKSTYKGKVKDDTFKQALKNARSVLVPGFKGVFRGAVFKTFKSVYIHNYTCYCDNFIALEDNRSITGYAREYISGIADSNTAIIKLLSYQEFHDTFSIPYAIASDGYLLASYNEGIKELYDWVVSHTRIITKQELKDYIVECKKDAPKTVYTSGKSIIHFMRFTKYESYDSPKTCNDFNDVQKELAKCGKAVVFQGKDCFVGKDAEDRKFEDIAKSLYALGYKIIWVANAVYKDIVKLKIQNKNCKSFSNIFLNYQDILNNLSASEEMQIIDTKVYDFAIEAGDGFYRYYNVYNRIVPTVLPEKDVCKLFKERLTKISSNESLIILKVSPIFSNFAPKHYIAKEYLKYIENIKPICREWAQKSREILNIVNGYNQSTRVCNYLFLLHRLKERKPVNYSELQKLKNDYVIKILYNE